MCSSLSVVTVFVWGVCVWLVCVGLCLSMGGCVVCGCVSGFFLCVCLSMGVKLKWFVYVRLEHVSSVKKG